MSFDNKQVLKWYGEGRVPLPFAINRVFDVAKTSQWSLVKQRKDAKSKKDKAKKEEHAANNVKSTAVLVKTGDWSANFSYFIRSGAGKSRADQVYNKISPNITYLYGRNRPPLVKFFKDYFTLDAVACNFNTQCKYKKAGKTKYGSQKFPYVWDAHHMIPGEAFTQVKAGVRGAQPIFNARQLRLMLMSDYNVNNGHNLIALPTNRMDFYQPVHDLIQHPSNHANYTSRVVSEMKQVAKKLEQLTDDLDKPHADVVVKIAASLNDLEDELWRLLVAIGKAAVASVVAKQELKLKTEDKELLKYQTADGKTTYPLLALG